jgi:uncharacterized protein (TIGR02922 family)
MEENKPNENSEKEKRLVTILYYSEVSLELMHDVQLLPQNKNGRVIIPADFKADKSIVAVCDGEVVILNKVGDRV